MDDRACLSGIWTSRIMLVLILHRLRRLVESGTVRVQTVSQTIYTAQKRRESLTGGFSRYLSTWNRDTFFTEHNYWSNLW